ncbi:MAG: co-chaperone GroES [Rickettsiales bacterium]|jgi:chaperonin GroES|nr:co-chaperone GroES [Rickettsiales bacterium]
MLKPLHNFVLLERLDEDARTAGGIIIPDNAREKPSRARVVAAGPGTKDEKTTVKSGDIVLFAKWASSANEVKIDGRDFILIKETDILGIL